MNNHPARPADLVHFRSLSARLMVLILGLAAAAGAGAAGDGVPHRQVADMLYEVAFANRKVYTRDVVQRLTIEDSVITASEYFHDKQALPLPAQMFRLAAEEFLDHTDAYWLALRALTPINPASGPLTPVEEQGTPARDGQSRGAFLRRGGDRRPAKPGGRLRGRGERRGVRRMPQRPRQVAAERLPAR